MKNFDLSLYLVTDRKLNPNLDLIQVIEQAIEGGVTIVQLREKKMRPNEIENWAKKLLPILNKKRIPLIINDHPEVAKRVGAAGVHLGPKDLTPKEARSILGKEAIIGLSIESTCNHSKIDLSEVDYLAASPVFSTATKPDSKSPHLISGLRALRKLSPLPLVAIGGIHSENLTEVLSTGVDGIAVCRAICGSPTPKIAAIQLRRGKGTPPRVLTIAGSDAGGGAGIQADLKAIQALSCYGMSAITALTAQNTRVVRSICPVDPLFIKDQIETVLEDIGVDAVKVGMLFSKEIIRVVAETISKYGVKNVVVDPVMISKSGDNLLQPTAIKWLREKLLPLATIITPNLPEAKILGENSLQSHQFLVVKGGHGADADDSNDQVVSAEGNECLLHFCRVQTQNTHGTGCTYSAAIASYLARGLRGLDAIKAARLYLQGAILRGSKQKLGFGHGPVDHAWNLREVL